MTLLNKIASKYNRKGDGSGSLNSLLDDMIYITDKHDRLLFLINIQTDTKYNFDQIVKAVLEKEKYSTILDDILSNYSSVNFDTNELLYIAIKNEAYENINILTKYIPIPELNLSRGGYECLLLAIRQTFAVFDKVLGLVIEFMAHTNNLANLELLILFMSICIQNKEIDKLSSFATGALFLTKDESAVKLMLNSAAEMVLQYMDPEDVDEVVKDINSRYILSKYLNSEK